MTKHPAASHESGVKVVVHDQKSGKEFFIFCNEDMIEKWRKDKSTPLVDVVQSFNIYEVDNGGNIGVASTPSKQTLINAFGTSNDSAVVEQILVKGTVKHIGKQHAAHTKDRASRLDNIDSTAVNAH